jgi:hypothetical protein
MLNCFEGCEVNRDVCLKVAVPNLRYCHITRTYAVRQITELTGTVGLLVLSNSDYSMSWTTEQ